MTSLSSDLITEVVSRLPPKSLLRFRCVSKSLCSEIDSPEFMKLHLRRSIERGSHQAIAFSSAGHVRLFEHLPDFPIKLSSAEDVTPPQVRPLSDTPVRFIGHCRGLIALAIESGDVVIWNPITRKRWIPPQGGNSRKSSFGFGYDSLSEDYKLVRVRWLHEYESDFQVSVYSFKSNSWRLISNLANPFPGRRLGQHGVLAHEAVHFVYFRYLLHDGFRDEFYDEFDYEPRGEFEVYIKAFDLHTEKFRDVVVKLPNHEDGGLVTLDVTVLGGHFSIVRFGGGEWEESSEMEAWVLKDYDGNEESWAKLFRVSLPWSQIVQSKPLMEGGNRVLVHYSGGRCAWIDLETRSVEEVRVESNQAIQDATLLVASIESLDVGIADNMTFSERRVQQSKKRRRVRRHGW